MFFYHNLIIDKASILFWSLFLIFIILFLSKKLMQYYKYIAQSQEKETEVDEIIGLADLTLKDQKEEDDILDSEAQQFL